MLTKSHKQAITLPGHLACDRSCPQLASLSFAHPCPFITAGSGKLTKSLPNANNLTLNNTRLAHRDRLQIRNIQRATHTCILPESGLGHGEQSGGGTEIEDGGGAAAVEVVETVGV